MISRKEFLALTAKAGIGLMGLQLYACASKQNPEIAFGDYGKLVKDPAGILDLPKGFTYTSFSKWGDEMDDGFLVPGSHDGMAAFPGENGNVVLIRNHELHPDQLNKSPFGENNERYTKMDKDYVYDNCNEVRPALGGTTTVIYNPNTKKVEKQFLSLVGTVYNCAGGPTPWGTWLTCEEFEDVIDEKLKENNSYQKKHGYVFEISSKDDQIQKPVALKDLGRFEHEAACIDPNSGIVYLTEDKPDSCFYRMIPNEKGNLAAGGKLQALMIVDKRKQDTRNWEVADLILEGQSFDVQWIDLEDVHQEDHVNDLRYRAFNQGAAIFARGEGITMGDNELYFCCTSGGKKHLGQVFRYHVSSFEGKDNESSDPSRLELFIESQDSEVLEACDNIEVTPWGDVIICEDNSSRSSLVLVNRKGKKVQFANTIKHKSEFAGACFSPDGKILFVNLQKPGITFAIEGPWKKIS